MGGVMVSIFLAGVSIGMAVVLLVAQTSPAWCG